jgi:hypothetical protein
MVRVRKFDFPGARLYGAGRGTAMLRAPRAPSILEPLGGLRECVSDALIKLRFAVHDSDTDESFGRRADERRRNPS